MSKSESIVVGVLSTVVGGLILVWILDWLPHVWTAGKTLGHWLWSVLAYETTLPIWVFLITGAVLFIAARVSISPSASMTQAEATSLQ